MGISHRSANKNSRPPKIYNLDVILSVGYRVKSKKGTAFRKWSSSVLHEYITKGYVINQRKLNAPNLGEIVQMLDEYRMVDSDLLISGNGMLEFLIAYNKGLKILDDYDHKAFQIPAGSEDIYRISYEECMNVILESEYSRKKDNFAKERDESFMSSISVIYQTFDGKELYESLESKAANLLYLITKNHSFIDGNKRIASIIFLYFLDINNALFINGRNRISNETLATLTILIASSNPKDKELIINLILVLLEV